MSEDPIDPFGRSARDQEGDPSRAFRNYLQLVASWFARLAGAFSMFIGALNAYTFYAMLGKRPFGRQDLVLLYGSVLFLSGWLIFFWIASRMQSQRVGAFVWSALLVIVVLEILFLARVVPQMLI